MAARPSPAERIEALMRANAALSDPEEARAVAGWPKRSIKGWAQ